MPKFDVDAELVKKLAKLINDTGLTELEYAEGEKRIRLTRGQIGGTTMVTAAPAASAAPAAPVVEAKPAAPVDAVTSPMVGTAYMSPAPGAKAFIGVGSKVKVGDSLLIIEAMKVMNPIKSPKGGTVTQILVADAQPVEFGQPLVVIE
jgi:acetyl-CoA carboxylase biotin carboxyl carrier protein